MYRSGQVDGVSDFGQLPRRAQEDGRSPEPAGGVDGDDELHAVGHHQGDPVPGAHPLGGQMTGKGVAETVEVTERPAPVPTPQRVTIAESVSGSPEGVVHQDRPPSETFFSKLRSTVNIYQSYTSHLCRRAAGSG